MGTPVHAIQVESLFFLNKETKSSLEMPNVKLTYFNLRGRGEPCRIMLAYGGIKYEDERIPPPWDPATTWPTLKPNTPFGVLPSSPGTGRRSASRWPVPGSWPEKSDCMARVHWSRLRWTRSLM